MNTTATPARLRTRSGTKPTPPPRDLRRWQRRVLAVLLRLHGVAHLVGTTDAINAIGDDTTLDYLFGHWTITNTATLATAAAVWTTLAAIFALAAMTAWRNTRRSTTLIVGASAASLVACLIALPQTAIGIPVNVALLAIAALTSRPTKASS